MLFSVSHFDMQGISGEIFVHRVRSGSGRVLTRPVAPLQRRPKMSFRKALREASSVSAHLLNGLSGASRNRAVRALNMSALAHSSGSLENQLVSLWSAVEVLLSEPKGDTSRIEHYTELIVPCVCHGYVRRALVSAMADLNAAYGPDFNAIVDEEVSGADRLEKFLAIVTLAGREPLRERMVALCEGNPLARHRLWLLENSLKTPSSVRKYCADHEVRVRWQIQRVYRLRNFLVHSGRQVRFLEVALMNLDEYYRSMFSAIVGAIDEEKGIQSDIDHCINGVQVRYRIRMKELVRRGREAAFRERDIPLLLSV